MVRAGKEAGLDVTLVDVLPWNNGHPAADDPIAELNRAIAEIGRSEDVEVVPFHDELEDPPRPGRWRRNSPTTATIPRSRATAGSARCSRSAWSSIEEARRGTGVGGASPVPAFLFPAVPAERLEDGSCFAPATVFLVLQAYFRQPGPPSHA